MAATPPRRAGRLIESRPLRSHRLLPPRVGRFLGRLVDLDEAQVVVGHPRRRILARPTAVDEALERLAPDRAADGEPDVAVDRGPLAQPVIDLVVVGTATEDDADDAVATACAALGRDPLAVGALVDALDLPDVRLDPGVAAARRSRGASAPGAARRRSGRSRRPTEASCASSAGTRSSNKNLRSCSCSQSDSRRSRSALAPVHLARPRQGCSGRGPWRSRGQSARCGRRSPSPYSKSNSLWPLFSTGIASLIPLALARLGNLCRGAELLVDERTGHGGIGATAQRRHDALEDQVLAGGDPLGFLGRRIALDSEALGERAAVVEGEDEELAAVAEIHVAQVLPAVRVCELSPGRTGPVSSRATRCLAFSAASSSTRRLPSGRPQLAQ